MKKETTRQIKGIAILLMIFHHFCGTALFPKLGEMWIRIGASCKICVAIYAVLSGYGYFFAKEKTVRYGLKKIWGLLEIYWLSLFTLFIPAAIRGGWRLTPGALVIQLFGLYPNLNFFAWYVFFYVFCMLAMPFLYRIFRKNLLRNVLIALLIPYALEILLHSVPAYSEIRAVYVLFDCMLYLPCFLSGYLMAKHGVMDNVNRVLPKQRAGRMIVCIVGIVAVFFLRMICNSVYGFQLDVFYAPAFVCFAAALFEACGKKPLRGTFSILGKYSAGMWFFHAVFFSTYICDTFQPILRMVKPPVLMYLWCVALSLAGAYAYQGLLNGLKQLKNKVVDK